MIDGKEILANWSW